MMGFFDFVLDGDHGKLGWHPVQPHELTAPAPGYAYPVGPVGSVDGLNQYRKQGAPLPASCAIYDDSGHVVGAFLSCPGGR